MKGGGGPSGGGHRAAAGSSAAADDGTLRAARLGATAGLYARLATTTEYMLAHGARGFGLDARTRNRMAMVRSVIERRLAAGEPPDQVVAALNSALAEACPGLFKPYTAMLTAAREGIDRSNIMDDGGYDDDGGGSSRSADELDAEAPAKRVAQAAQYRARAAAFTRAGFEAGTLEDELLRHGGSCDAHGCDRPASVLHFCGPNTGELLCAAHDGELHFDRACSRRYTLVFWRRSTAASGADAGAAPAAGGAGTGAGGSSGTAAAAAARDAPYTPSGVVMRELAHNEFLRPGASVFVCAGDGGAGASAEGSDSASSNDDGGGVWECIGVDEFEDIVRRNVSYGVLLPAWERCPTCRSRRVRVTEVDASITRTVHGSVGNAYSASPPSKLRCVHKPFGSSVACGTEWTLGERPVAPAGGAAMGVAAGGSVSSAAAAAAATAAGVDDAGFADGPGLAAPTPFDRTHWRLPLDLLPLTPERPRVLIHRGVLDDFDVLNVHSTHGESANALQRRLDSGTLRGPSPAPLRELVMTYRQEKHFLLTTLGGMGAQCVVCGDDNARLIGIDGNMSMFRCSKVGGWHVSWRTPGGLWLSTEKTKAVLAAYDRDVKGRAKELVPSDCGDWTANKVAASRFVTLDETGVIAGVCGHLNWQFAFPITTGERLSHHVLAYLMAVPMGARLLLDDIACMVRRHLESLGGSKAGFADGAAHELLPGTAGHTLAFVCDPPTAGPGPAIHLRSRPLRYQHGRTDDGGSGSNAHRAMDADGDGRIDGSLTVGVPTTHNGSGTATEDDATYATDDGAMLAPSVTEAGAALAALAGMAGAAAVIDGGADGDAVALARVQGLPQRLLQPVPSEVSFKAAIPVMHAYGHACNSTHGALHVGGAGDYGEPNEQSFAAAGVGHRAPAGANSGPGMYQMLHEIERRAFNGHRNLEMAAFVVQQLGTKVKKLRQAHVDEAAARRVVEGERDGAPVSDAELSALATQYAKDAAGQYGQRAGLRGPDPMDAVLEDGAQLAALRHALAAAGLGACPPSATPQQLLMLDSAVRGSADAKAALRAVSSPKGTGLLQRVTAAAAALTARTASAAHQQLKAAEVDAIIIAGMKRLHSARRTLMSLRARDAGPVTDGQATVGRQETLKRVLSHAAEVTARLHRALRCAAHADVRALAGKLPSPAGLAKGEPLAHAAGPLQFEAGSCALDRLLEVWHKRHRLRESVEALVADAHAGERNAAAAIDLVETQLAAAVSCVPNLVAAAGRSGAFTEGSHHVSDAVLFSTALVDVQRPHAYALGLARRLYGCLQTLRQLHAQWQRVAGGVALLSPGALDGDIAMDTLHRTHLRRYGQQLVRGEMPPAAWAAAVVGSQAGTAAGRAAAAAAAGSSGTAGASEAAGDVDGGSEEEDDDDDDAGAGSEVDVDVDALSVGGMQDFDATGMDADEVAAAAAAAGGAGSLSATEAGAEGAGAGTDMDVDDDA